MNKSFLNKDIIKYLVVAGLVYTILKIVPAQQINDRDLILILGVITIGFIGVDYLLPKKEGFANEEIMPLEMENPEIENKQVAKVSEAIKQMVNETQTKKQPELKYNPNDWDKPAQTNCDFAIQNVKTQLEREINDLKEQLQSRIDLTSGDKIANKYLEALLIDLNERELIDMNDIENIKIKLKSRLLTLDEVISSLETLKKEGKGKVKPKEHKSKDDRDYNELPSDFLEPIGDKIANEWANEYSILNTDKWKVPTMRPPVCINNSPCKVCPSDSSTYPVSLMKWDDSRKVSQNKINKQWAMDQSNSQPN